MTAHFITGAGTDVGKTVVTSLLCRQIADRGTAVRALKPVITGYDQRKLKGTDSGCLLEALGRKVTRQAVEAISPWR
jgi:dethiobiotin synthetase